jgi:DNA-binding transcriptional MerR regulator
MLRARVQIGNRLAWLVNRHGIVLNSGVSLAEIRKAIEGLTTEERLELAALIAHLNRADDPDFQTELDRRAEEMDAGNKTPLSELERLHRHLGG